MDENKMNEQNNNPEILDESQELQRIQVTRHLWPDEKENLKLKKENRFLTKLVYISSIICLIVGLMGGKYLRVFRNQPVGKELYEAKFHDTMQIMENQWFFAKDVDNLDETLADQALVGITSNAIDPHTNYLSKKDMQEFVQHLNRSFVGIGIQYTATADGLHMVERVFKNSPAEKAGVLPGDIIHMVDGKLVDHLENTEIAELVRGEEGTSVKIDFLRNGKTVSLNIVREEIHNTTFGEIRDDIGYLQIAQFGESTDEEVRSYLEDFHEKGIEHLILDLRNDGGGYLDSLHGICNCLLPKDTVYIQREFADGKHDESKTNGDEIVGFNKIAILVNENTASAAEALTMALKEQRKDVTVIGNNTYGKGTVQITMSYTDGSALKFTNSKWLSPKGVWINNVGIKPDIEVNLPDILNAKFVKMSDGELYEIDSVGEPVKIAQMALSYLGYGKLREDGYFDEATKQALTTYQVDHDLEGNGQLNETIYASLISSVLLDFNQDTSKDTQYQKAKEVVNAR